MFAFALWDRQSRTLRLVRDRFGEKPLYYGWAGRDLVFASELKAICAHPRFERTIDRRALHHYTARGHVPAPWSIYQGIYKLEPGCILSIEAGAAGLPFTAPPAVGLAADGVRLTRYWSYRDVVRDGLADPLKDEAEALDALEATLARAVREQSMADVPVGAFLSGGIDSSTIVALYQKYSDSPVRTFTIGFEEDGFDEAIHARAVAAHLGSVHSEHCHGQGSARGHSAAAHHVRRAVRGFEPSPDLPRQPFRAPTGHRRADR
jgi:asparagine synthase (glutamine-hydrolysing)